MRTLKLTLAYDGTNYVGWQRQANGVSVQEKVEEAFLPLMGDGVSRPPTVAGASRTDAGVHALGQVASVIAGFDFAASAVQRALNVRLPADIRVIGVVDAMPGFHARHHAVSKSYRYRIATTPVLSPFDRFYVWHAPGGRDLDAILPAKVQWKSHNYNHLMEQPTLFYATCIILILMQVDIAVATYAAWAYVGLRVLHSLVQSLSNRIRYRFGLFLLASLCLVTLVAIAVLALVLPML